MFPINYYYEVEIGHDVTLTSFKSDHGCVCGGGRGGVSAPQVARVNVFFYFGNRHVLNADFHCTLNKLDT